MKKISSFLVALMLLTTVSCSEKQNSELPENSTAQNYTAEKLTNVANYKKEAIDLPKEIMQVYTFMPYNDGNEYLLLGTGKYTPQFWKTNVDFTEFEDVEFPEFDIGKSYDLDTANDGTTVVFVNHADYGDLPPISPYEYPEDYDEELYDANAEYKFMIKTFKDGKLVSSADVSGYGGTAEKSSNINGVYSDGEIVITKLSGAYEIFSIDGNYICELEYDSGDIEQIGHDRTGRLICAVSYEENDVDKLKICLIGNDGKLSDMNNVIYDFSESVQGIQQGTGEYDFFIWSRSTVFGVKSGNYDIVPLMNINVAGLTSDTLIGVMPQSDGNMSAINNNYSDFSVNFKKYIPRTPEEMENIKILTYGVFNFQGQSQYAHDIVNAWNDEGHDFMLQLKEYIIKENSDGTALEVSDLAEDALSGNLPDIMEVLFDNSVENVKLGEMGALCDLYEFIDNDETLSRDSFVPNVLECIATDGKLYSFSDYFDINAGKVAKTKFVGDAEDWTFEKYVDMTINPPIETEIPYDSKQCRKSYISSTDWVDIENATCHFTDESFVKFLNWCNEPDNIESDYPDWNNQETSYEEDQKNHVIQQRKFMDDKEIFSPFNLGDYSDYAKCTKGQFAGEPVTLLETPIIRTYDNLAITSNSENKELAWEYLKSKISDETYTKKENEYHGFPITKSGLEMLKNYERTHYTDYTQYDETKDDPYWADYHGLVYHLSFAMSDAMQIGEITDDDIKAVDEIIAKAKPYNSLNLTRDFYDIIDEETDNFFNGRYTAEQCAEVLQSRMSIYLSEQFS